MFTSYKRKTREPSIEPG